jgi:hypothetical protein
VFIDTQDEKRIIIPCSCSSLHHAIQMDYFDFGNYQEICITLTGYTGSFWNRLKTAWKLIFRHVWDLQVDTCLIIHPKDFNPKELADWLNTLPVKE